MMEGKELRRLIEACLVDEVSPRDHQRLQERLKSCPKSRAMFREVMDVEAGLRAWASVEHAADQAPAALAKRGSPDTGTRRARRAYAWIAVAASLAVLALAWQFRPRPGPPNPPVGPDVTQVAYVGTFGQQRDCVWDTPAPAIPGGPLQTNKLSLVSGIAELKLDSGTQVLMQGPCDLQIVDAASANLLTGSLVVRVTELSDGFTLKTPHGVIVDEGSEYAVALREDATEVHVFDGTVVWEPDVAGPDLSERIESGEARRYARSRPHDGKHIPLGRRLFVRRIESAVREEAGTGLVAYDGFENLAGRIRSGRSGFGWRDGWRTVRRGRGMSGAITDAPEDVVFGIERSGRRLLELANGDTILRSLEAPLPLESGRVYYASFVLQRRADQDGPLATTGKFFELSLGGDGPGRGHRSRRRVTFGVTSEGYPFIKSGGSIASTASPIDFESAHFFVAKILVLDDRTTAYLRVYREQERVDSQEPATWTTVGAPSPGAFDLTSVRLSVGTRATYAVDELKVGETWSSVTSSAAGTP